MSKHRNYYKRYKEGKGNYITSINILQYESAKIELVENYPCDSKEQLIQREGFYIRNNDCVNKYIPDRTIKEWNEDNKDKIKEYSKEWRELNKEYKKEQQKEYYQKNKELINKQKKEYGKQYRQANKDKIKEYGKQYYQQKKEQQQLMLNEDIKI